MASLRGRSPTERNAFIRSFVKKITVKGQEAVLRYTAPWLPGGLENKGADSLEPRGGLSTAQGWWAILDSNQGPQSYQDCALTA